MSYDYSLWWIRELLFKVELSSWQMIIIMVMSHTIVPFMGSFGLTIVAKQWRATVLCKRSSDMLATLHAPLLWFVQAKNNIYQKTWLSKFTTSVSDLLPYFFFFFCLSPRHRKERKDRQKTRKTKNFSQSDYSHGEAFVVHFIS